LKIILAALFAALLASPAAAAPTCPADMSGAAYLCRAVDAADHQKYVEAADAFEKAAAASPAGEPLTQRMLAGAGNMWIAAGQPGKAALALDRALAGNGLQAEQRGLALLDRARAAEAQNDLKAARRFFTEAAPTVDRDPFAWYFSAALAVREADLPGAKMAIGRALSLAPTMPEALFEAGYIANEEGDTAKARDYWNRAMNADPGGKIGASAKAALGALGAPLTVPPNGAKP
jgi:tetratricopeptide (TPR) repeat protein